MTLDEIQRYQVKAAAIIARELFLNGQGRLARRLVVEDAEGKIEGTGYSEEGAAYTILKTIVKLHLLPTPRTVSAHKRRPKQ